jgi:hypothetical protein
MSKFEKGPDGWMADLKVGDEIFVLMRSAGYSSLSYMQRIAVTAVTPKRVRAAVSEYLTREWDRATGRIYGEGSTAYPITEANISANAEALKQIKLEQARSDIAYGFRDMKNMLTDEEVMQIAEIIKQARKRGATTQNDA